MTDPTPMGCLRRTTLVPPSTLLPPPRPPVAHGPCCYWDHATARWVPLTISRTG